MRILVATISVFFILFNLADTAQVFLTFGFVLMPIQSRAINLGFVLVLIFFLTSAKKTKSESFIWYDMLLIMMVIASTIYIVIVGPVVAEGRAYATDLDCFFR